MTQPPDWPDELVEQVAGWLYGGSGKIVDWRKTSVAESTRAEARALLDAFGPAIADAEIRQRAKDAHNCRMVDRMQGLCDCAESIPEALGVTP